MSSDTIEKDKEDHDLTTLTTLGYSLQRKIAADTKKTQIPQFGHIKGSQGGDFIISLDNKQKMFTSPKLKYPSEKTTEATQKFPKKGIYTAEVDLIGRIDDITKHTVVTISAGLSVSLWISGLDKYEAIQNIKDMKPQWGNTRINIYIYSTLLYLLLKDHIHKLDVITVDLEYIGYESLIKQRVMNLLRKNGNRSARTK